MTSNKDAIVQLTKIPLGGQSCMTRLQIVSALESIGISRQVLKGIF